jgi:hypothetical protein
MFLKAEIDKKIVVSGEAVGEKHNDEEEGHEEPCFTDSFPLLNRIIGHIFTLLNPEKE